MEKIAKERLWEMAKDGLTIEEMAAVTGINSTTISLACKIHFGGAVKLKKDAKAAVLEELKKRFSDAA